jgi:hypothetical protein
MDINIATFTDDKSSDLELRSLQDWLLHERPRPGRVGRADKPAKRGEMGAASDALQVALASGGALTVLAGAVSTWLSTRSQNVKVKVTRPDGETLDLDATTTNPHEALERFLEFASRSD